MQMPAPDAERLHRFDGHADLLAISGLRVATGPVLGAQNRTALHEGGDGWHHRKTGRVMSASCCVGPPVWRSHPGAISGESHRCTVSTRRAARMTAARRSTPPSTTTGSSGSRTASAPSTTATTASPSSSRSCRPTSSWTGSGRRRAAPLRDRVLDHSGEPALARALQPRPDHHGDAAAHVDALLRACRQARRRPAAGRRARPHPPLHKAGVRPARLTSRVVPRPGPRHQLR